MGFGAAIGAGFANYAVFRGRAKRSEYWYFVLFCGLVASMAGIFDSTMSNDIGVIGAIWHLATILPTIALATRRLHDVDRSGWWQLLWFIPVIGWVVLLVWLCTAGTPGANRFD
ncbi:MAG: DUF805 domain-containing protein [Rhodospirillales bacterium]